MERTYRVRGSFVRVEPQPNRALPTRLYFALPDYFFRAGIRETERFPHSRVSTANLGDDDRPDLADDGRCKLRQLLAVAAPFSRPVEDRSGHQLRCRRLASRRP